MHCLDVPTQEKRVGAPDDGRNDPRGRAGSRYTLHEKQAAGDRASETDAEREVTDGRQRRRAARNDGYDSGLFERQRELLTYLTARNPSQEGRQKWKRKRELRRRKTLRDVFPRGEPPPCSVSSICRSGRPLARRCLVPSDGLFLFSSLFPRLSLV